jgi:outer membrane protein assembly factor BamB
VLADDNDLVCLTRDEGKVRWASQLRRYEDEPKKSDPIVWAGPVLGGNRLIVLSSLGEAVSISPNTGELTDQQTMAAGYLGPVIADNAFYLLSDEANLSAYR